MMSNLYFTSDWHVGHKNIQKLRTFVSSEAHNEQLIIRGCRNLTKRDTLYLLGDICFTEDSLKFVSDLPKCRKILIKGNHDLVDTRKLLEVFDEVHGHHRTKKYWLNHCPIHPDELRGRWCIHGHVHYATLPDERYLNVCPEYTLDHFGSYLVSLDDVKKCFGQGGIGVTEPKINPWPIGLLPLPPKG